MALNYLKVMALRTAPVGVDRERKILCGYVVAQEGPFKSEGRGEFDAASLRSIIQLGNNARNGKGIKSRFTHPSLSEDGIGKFLGRAKNFTLGKATDARTGKTVPAVRADLHFDKTAMETPPSGGRPLGDYVMSLAESDPDAISSSVVIEVDEEYRLNKDGTAVTDTEGEPLPPLWRPKRLHASDIVDTGDAVDGLLSCDQLSHALSGDLTPEQLAPFLRFDRVQRIGSVMLDQFFRDADEGEIRHRCQSWLERYLNLRFNEGLPPKPTPNLDKVRERLNRMAKRA